MCQEWQTLSRRKSKIRPLVAARVRSVRRPPGGVSHQNDNRLRLRSRDGGDECPASAEPPGVRAGAIDQSIELLRAVVEALRRAAEGLDDMRSLLGELEAVFQNRDSADRSADDLSQTDLARVDRVLDCIERFVDRIRFGGCRLFEGDFVIDLSGCASGSASSVTLPSLRTASLGDPVAGTLERLGSDSGLDGAGANIASARRIVEGALRRVAEHRLDLVEILENQVIVELESRQIALENATAAAQAASDVEFAIGASRVTALNALADRQARSLRPKNTGVPPALTLSRTHSADS